MTSSSLARRTITGLSTTSHSHSHSNQYLPPSPLDYSPPIPSKHQVHVCTLHLRAHSSSLDSLTFFTQFSLRSARALGLPTSGQITLPTQHELFTTPRSPFAHKKSQQNFGRSTHKRAIKVYDGNPQIVHAWLAYLRQEQMGGVGIKAQLFHYKELGWGNHMVEEEGEGTTAEPNTNTTSDITSLAESLINDLTLDVQAQEQEQEQHDEEEMTHLHQERGQRKQLEEQEGEGVQGAPSGSSEPVRAEGTREKESE